jgi:hypothetical protein
MVLINGGNTNTRRLYGCMACGLVFDSEEEVKRHEEQHPGMVRKAISTAGETEVS